MNNITYAVSVDVNNPIIPYNVYVASVLDSNVRYLEITLYENGSIITLSNTATATASLVTDNVLIDDSVECTISNNIITVPLEDLQRHGNLDVQVTVTEDTKVLAIPFPIQVRVTPNIAENAQIVDDSLGSYAEVVQEIAEARGDHETLNLRITAASSPETIYEIIQDYLIEYPIREIKGFISPEMFGAVGNGNNDDSAALQLAIKRSISDNVPFRGRPGAKYLITNTINIQIGIDEDPEDGIDTSNPNYGCDCFDFQGAELIAKAGSDLPYMVLYKNIATDRENSHSKAGIRNLVLNGNLENAHTGLYIERSSAAVFEKININDCRRGIYMKASTESIIRDCTSRRNPSLDLYNQLANDELKLVGVFAETNRGEEFETSRDQEVIDDDEQKADETPEEVTQAQQSVLTGSKINLTKTQCIGFELVGNDSFIEDCVAIDHVIGIKLSGGDIKVSGCHPWNYAQNQLKSSCCFFTNGGNYFVNNTCDRFYIGVYCRYNTPNFFTNTLFTNQALADEDNSEPCYCFYLNEKFALRSQGRTVFARNTRVNGNSGVDERNTLWCNVPFTQDENTNGTHVFGYLPKGAPAYKRISSTSAQLTLLAGCMESDMTNKNFGHGSSNGIIKASNCTVNTSTQGGVKVHKFTALETQSSAASRITIPKENFQTGHTYFIGFHYHTENEKARYHITKVDSTMLGDTDLINDGNEHDFGDIFTYGGDTTVLDIGLKVGASISEDDQNLYISQLCVFDITDLVIPRYLFENKWAYGKRIYRSLFAGGQAANSGNKTIAADTTVSYVSLEKPVNFDYSDNTADGDHDYYDVRYDYMGRTVFIPNSTRHYDSVSSPTRRNYAYIPIGNSLALDMMVINANGAAFRFAQGDLGTWFESKHTSSGNYVGQTNPTTFALDNGNARLRFYPRLPSEGINPVKLLSLRVGEKLGCDALIADSGGVIPYYPNGEIYLVKKNTESAESLPTVVYQTTMLEDGQGYVLTDQDKSDIANIVLGELSTTEGVLYGN